MAHPAETATDTLIARLRGHAGEMPLPVDDEVFLPGLWGSFDAEQGALSGRLQAGDGALLRVSIAAERPGRWCTLSMNLGWTALPEGAVIGLVADLRSSRPTTITLHLRAIHGTERRDVAFDEGFALTPEGGAQVALLEVPPGSVLSAPDQRLTVVMDLPQTDIDIVFRDMRLFVLPDPIPDPASDRETAAPAESPVATVDG